MQKTTIFIILSVFITIFLFQKLTYASVDIEPAFIYGDINFDNSVDSTDIVLLRRYILSISNVLSKDDPCRSEFAADVNGDGVFTHSLI